MFDIELKFSMDDASIYDTGNWNIQGVTHNLYMRIGEYHDMTAHKDSEVNSNTYEMERQSMYRQTQAEYQKAIETISHARKMLRYEELRLRHAYNGCKKIKEGNLRFHNPVWKQYYDEQLVKAKSDQENLCLDCGSPTKMDFMCASCLLG